VGISALSVPVGAVDQESCAYSPCTVSGVHNKSHPQLMFFGSHLSGHSPGMTLLNFFTVDRVAWSIVVRSL
jgi:hypothetical protein